METAMRRYEIPPALVAAMRSRALAASFREVGVPLTLELPCRGEPRPRYSTVRDEPTELVDRGSGLGEEDDDSY